MFEGGNLKAATTFLMGNWKKNYKKDLHCQQIWKHKQIIHTCDLLKIQSYLYDNWNPVFLLFYIFVPFIHAVCHERPGISWATENKFLCIHYWWEWRRICCLVTRHKTEKCQGGIDTPKEKWMYTIPDFCEKMIKSLKHFLSKTDPNPPAY